MRPVPDPLPQLCFPGFMVVLTVMYCLAVTTVKLQMLLCGQDTDAREL